MHRLFKRYGFAFLVFVALTCASFLAGGAAVPEPVPDYALRSEEVYRLEIGVAFFAAFYLATMAILLAFSGRGFAEFGTRGLRAARVIREQRSNSDQEGINRRVRQKMSSHDQRLEKLESER